MVENSPALPLPLDLHGHVGDLQLLRVIDPVVVNHAVSLLGHRPAVVHGVEAGRLLHPDGVFTEQHIGVAEIGQHVLGKAQVRQPVPHRLHGGAAGLLPGRPVHGIPGTEQIAAGNGGGQKAQKHQGKGPVRQPDLTGRDGIARLVQGPGELAKAEQNFDIDSQQNQRKEPAAVARQGQQADKGIEHHQPQGAARPDLHPGPALDVPDSAPEGDIQREL